MDKNKGDNRVRSDRIISDALKQKPVFALDLPAPAPEELLFLEEGDRKTLDMKARYDAQLIAHERTERKAEDLESALEQEREKNAQLRQELLKSIDIEKEVKAANNGE